MASSNVYDTVKNHLVASFAAAGLPVLDGDQIEQQLEQGAQPFIVISDVTGYEELVGFGDPTALCFSELNIFDVQVFVPGPEGSRSARQLADQVRNELRLRRFPNIRVVEVDPAQITSSNDGLWTTAEFSTEVTYDSHYATPI